MLTFTEFLTEGKPFVHQGKKYSTAWGKWYCDGEIITQKEYQEASKAHKGAKGDEEDVHDWNHIPKSRDYYMAGGFPGGSKYEVKNTGLEVTYPHRAGEYPAGHTALKYNFSKDTKSAFKFYKSNAERKNKEVNKDDFVQYMVDLLAANIERKVNEYGDKNAKMDLSGIKSKITTVFAKYIEKNYEKISKK